MELEKINFCNSTVYKINNEHLINKTFNFLDLLLSLKLNEKMFPGPQPVAIEKKNINTLKTNKYVICEKSDGERYLILFLIIENNPLVLLLNRNNEFFFTELDIKPVIFEGTVFDAELIKNKHGVWTFLIHDCIAYNGINYMKKAHSQRYGAIIDFITNHYSYNDSNPFCIKTKLFYNYSEYLEETWEHILSTTENNIDGLIFTPVYSPIFFGRQNNLFKWKCNNNHTIDLLTKVLNNKKMYTYYSNNKVFRKIENNDSEYSSIIRFCNEPFLLLKGVVIEFKIVNDNLVPYRLRTDKSVGNSKITVDNTLKNISEALEIHSLV
jgi:hypothetical protein